MQYLPTVNVRIRLDYIIHKSNSFLVKLIKIVDRNINYHNEYIFIIKSKSISRYVQIHV